MNWLEENRDAIEIGSKGRLYHVELAPAEDEYLLWDKPLSEQSEKVKGVLAEYADRREVRKESDGRYGVYLVQSNGDKVDYIDGTYDSENEATAAARKYDEALSGAALYKRISAQASISGLRGIKNSNGYIAASEYLHSLGIRGIKYLNGASRSAGEGDYNYVIFDDKDVSITAKFSTVKRQAADRLSRMVDAVNRIVAGEDEATIRDLRDDLEQYGGTNDVTLVWGDEKKGLRHIGNKRGENVVAEVLLAVAEGKIAKNIPGKKTVHLVHGNTEAVLSLDEHGHKKTWLLTGWKIGEPDAVGEVGTQSRATQSGPTFSRSALGAGSSRVIIPYLDNLVNSGENPRFDRAGFYSASTPAATIRNALKASLNLSRIPIRVVQSLSELPDHIQADMRLFDIEAIDGVFDPETNSMYLVADYIPSVERARELLRHEWFHAGVADKELEALYRYYSQKDMARLERIADERGFDLSTRSGRLEAAGELAAQLAETNPRNLLLARIVARIKEWLRALGLNVEFGQAEVARIIRDAIQRVQTGPERTQGARALSGSAYSAAKGDFNIAGDNNAEARRQYEAVKVVRDKQGRLITEGGKRSKLNEHQYRQVRTPLFKEWFGDWEAAAMLRELESGKPIAHMKGDEVPVFKKLNDLAQWVGKYWSDHYGGYAVHPQLGKVELDTKAASDSIGHGLRKEKAQAFYLVPDIVENGMLLGKLPRQPNKPEAYLIGAVIKIGTADYKAYVEVRSDVNKQRLYVHEVVLRNNSPVESAFNSSAAETERPVEPQGAHHGAIYSFLQSLKNVNVSNVIDPETGEPLVMYHGTKASFDAFEHGRRPANPFLVDDNGVGFFFTENPGTSPDSGPWLGAAGFAGTRQVDGETRTSKGSNILPVFLSLKAPYKMSMSEYWHYIDSTKNGVLAREQIQALGYDGIRVGDNVSIAFDPTQVKSAIGNNGRFDKDDARITYSTPDQQDAAIAAHARAINVPAKVADMVRSLFELIGQSVPERLKANIGKVLSNPWFGSEGKPVRRKVVNLNVERSQNRNGIISDLFQASEGYTGVEGLDNILKNATKEERRQFNELIKYGDRNDVARTFTRDELYRGKTPFGKLSRNVVEAYKIFQEVMQAANRVRFQQLDELSLLPYKDQPWFDALVELLNRNQERMADMSREEAGDFHRLVRSLKRGLSDEQLKNGDNPAKVTATAAVIAAYRDFWAQVERVEKRHQGMMLSAFRDILGYRGELDKLKNEWGHLKGYAPRNRKDGDWHVSVYTTDDQGERVKVYMKPTLTEAGARRHVAEVRDNLEQYLKSTYDPAAEYEVEYERNQATPSELLAWKGSEVAVEALLNTAFDRAGMTGKMSAEEWHSLKHEVFQEIAKQIMAQGFGRHGIAREQQFIEGYDDTDYQVVLKEYITGMAGWLSKMRFAIETTSAAKEISRADPQDKVWVNDYVQDAMKNGTYLDELAATARSVGAVWYLGGKVSSALLNGFQNYTVGQAELSRVMKQAGIGKSAVALLAKAQKDVLNDFIGRKKGGAGTLSGEERDVLKRALREGTAQAQTVRMMSGSQEMGFGTAWKKITEYSMTPFAWVEQHINREPAMLAAYRAFKTTATGAFDQAAYSRAEEFVANTHYLMGRENLPEIVRKLGPLGKSAYLFQGYVHNYLHWMYNRARHGEFEAIARSLAAIAALGGVFALPGADDLDKWITRWFGVSYKLKFKAWMRRHAREYGTPGEALETFVNHGVTSVAGVDMSRALAVNIPFVSDPDRSFGERVGGVWGGLLRKPGMAMSAAQKGDYLRALENVLPEVAANPLRAARQYGRGATTLSGKPILDEDGRQMKYGGMDVAKKVFGFQPLEVSERTGMKSAERELSAVWNDERSDKLAALRVANSQEQVRAAIQDIIRWNRGLQQSQARGLVNPISSTSIQRARQFKTTKTDQRRMQWERGYVS